MSIDPLLINSEIDNRFKVREFPDRITLELTNHCNLKCIMCPRKFMKGPKGYLSFHLFNKIIDQISEHPGTALVPFFRGESLLHPECVSMLEYAKKKGVSPIQFTTNGTLLTEEASRALIDLEIDFISFSVDSIESGTYKSIRKGATIEETLKNIQIICDLKKKKGTKKPELQVSVVKTESTSNEINSFIQFWEDQVDRVRIYEEHSKDGNFGKLNYDGQQSSLKDRQPCLKPFSDMVIYWNGNVAICNHDWDRTGPIGNLNHDLIKDVWSGEVYKRLRRSHLENKSLEDLCEECDHWKTYYTKDNLIGELHF